MIKVFIPQSKGKNKTSVRGLWMNDEGKLFYDYLKIINDNLSGDVLLTYLEQLKAEYKQEAIFYIQDDCGCVFYGKEKSIDYLPKRFELTIDKRNRKHLRYNLRGFLKKYKGVTIYKEGNFYRLEVFYQ